MIFCLRMRKTLKNSKNSFPELHDAAFSNAIVNLISTCPQVDRRQGFFFLSKFQCSLLIVLVIFLEVEIGLYKKIDKMTGRKF